LVQALPLRQAAAAPKKKAAADPLDSLIEGPKKPTALEEKATEKADAIRTLWGEVVGATTFVISAKT